MADSYMKDYEAYLQQLSDGAVTEGLLYEPRVYFDYITLDSNREVSGHPEVFRNGEDFPVVITHMTAALAYLIEDYATVADERNIQGVGAYLNFHDQYYMNPPQQLGGGTIVRAAPLPAWINEVVATSDTVSRGISSWKFPMPFILSTRDTLEVQVGLYNPPLGESTVPVTVSFTGTGILSKQPYFLSGIALVGANSGFLTIDPESFLNDGAEPILMKSMTVVVQASSIDASPVGDARRAYIRCKQRGNGTNKQWFQGPLNVSFDGSSQSVPVASAAAINLGATTGRAIVHRFPQPLVWEPGEGVTFTAQAINGSIGDSNSITVALLGYVAVQ